MQASKESGSWREYDQKAISYTLITKDWEYEGTNYREWFLSPYGMVNALTKRLSSKKTYSTTVILSPKLKETLGISDETYDSKKMILNVGNLGNLGVKEFTHISCKICKKDFIPPLLHEYRSKLPENASYVDLINNWDALQIQPSLMDLAGCFFPLEEHVCAGPNGRRFIMRPCEHPPLHKKINITSTADSSVSSCSENIPPSAPSCQSTSTSSSSTIIEGDASGHLRVKRKVEKKEGENIVTLPKNIKVRMQSIDSILDPKMDMSTPCRDDIDRWAKKFMIKVVHSGAKKLVSNETSLEFYSTVMDGVREYHSEIMKKIAPEGETIPPPPKVTVDRNNIGKVHEALFQSFKESEDPSNPYNMFIKQDSGKFYSIMHDGIQKFGHELNGVFIRYVSPDMKVINIPWMLHEIPGGSLNSVKLISHLFDVIQSVQSVQCPKSETADTEISRILLRNNEALEFTSPPEYFKVCKLIHFDDEHEVINLEMISSPVLINADGCSTNVKAAKDMVEQFGFVSPSLRCTVHAADGSLKRMANSKTMNVEAVTEFLPFFRKVMKHFQLSGKSTSALNAVLDIMNMKKVHMVTFCPTRMAYLLTCCSQAVVLLAPLCDVLVTLDIKKEQRDYFLSPKSMFIMHILADLEPVFKKYFLKTLDTDDGLIIDCFRVHKEFEGTLSNELLFPKFDTFIENMDEDHHGNIIVNVIVSGDKHTITLNKSHRPVRRRRGEEQSKIDELRDEANTLKDQIVSNLIENVSDQCQANTVIEFASAFDLHLKLAFEKRIEYIEQLAKYYCNPSYVHNLEADDEEFWGKFKISIRYPAKIECQAEDILKEMKNLWPICNKHWRKFMNDKVNGNRNFWIMMSSQHTISHPYVFQLVDILFSMASTTGPLERSYSALAKICYKDRNKITTDHLEVLYFWST